MPELLFCFTDAEGIERNLILEATMLLEYPLQQHARHRAEPFQLAFVYRARSILGNPEEMKHVTLGSAVVRTALSRYAPCPLDPEPAAA
jgi:hypothetical protein